MSQKRIEEQFQNKLGNYASMIDDDQLWSEIEGRVPKKKKKKRFFFWFAFGLPVLALVLVVFWFFSQDGSEVGKASFQSSHLENENIILEKSNDENATIVNGNRTEENKTGEDILIKRNSSTSLRKIMPTENNVNTQLIAVNNSLDERMRVQGVASSSKVSSPLLDEKKPIDAGNTLALKRKVNAGFAIPTIDFYPKTDVINAVKIPRKKPKRPKGINPIVRPRPFVGVNYYAGIYNSKVKLSDQDERYIDFGEAYFSQGLSISYNQFITSRFYGRVILNADQSYKRYSDRINRDTIVSSSAGSQVLAYNEYQNGFIDTESGIPEVNGVFSRDIINNNVISSVSVGLGLGYSFPIGRINLNLEADAQRTVYYDLTGLGRDISTQKIENLNAFENYFSYAPKYAINSNINADYRLSKTLFLTIGIQYQLGINSILIEQTNHTEKINLLRGNLGIKKML